MIESTGTQLLCAELKARLDQDEAALGYPKPPRTLWAHSLRVGRRARRLAEQMDGVAPDLAFLAGVLHDAGKLRGGVYHRGDQPEEEASAEVAEDVLATTVAAPLDVVTEIATAIREMQSEDPEPPPLGKIVWDADALDKLGPSGVAVFFLKSGLRGRGLDDRLLERMSVELTYARAAPATMWTSVGEREAAQAAAYTDRYFRDLITALVSSGVFDVEIDTVVHGDMEIVSVGAPRCTCAGSFVAEVAERAGVICTELELVRRCDRCGRERTVRFCCPRARRRRDV